MSWETIVLLVGGVGCLLRAASVLVTGYESRSVEWRKQPGEPAEKTSEGKEHWLPRDLAVLWLTVGGVLLFVAATPTTPGRLIRVVEGAKSSAAESVSSALFLVMGPIMFLMAAFFFLPILVLDGVVDAIRDRDLRGLGTALLVMLFVLFFLAFIGLSWWQIAFG